MFSLSRFPPNQKPFGRLFQELRKSSQSEGLSSDGSDAAFAVPPDRTLLVGAKGVRVECHEFVLRLQSAYFRAAFSPRFRQDPPHEVRLPLTGLLAEHEDDAASLWRLLAYCYGCSVEAVPIGQLASLYQLSDYLEVADLRSQCLEKLRQASAAHPSLSFMRQLASIGMDDAFDVFVNRQLPSKRMFDITAEEELDSDGFDFPKDNT